MAPHSSMTIGHRREQERSVNEDDLSDTASGVSESVDPSTDIGTKEKLAR